MGIDYFSITLGFLAFTSLIVYGVISFIIYGNIKLKVFVWYSMYCFVLAIYIASKIYPELFSGFWSDSGMNWFIQCIYYTLYLRFALCYLQFQEHQPKWTHRILAIQHVLFPTAIVGYFLNIYGIIDMMYYFLYFFLPIMLFCAFQMIYHAWVLKVANRKYFLYGSIIYISLALFAFALTLKQMSLPPFGPIDFFFVGVILETLIFSRGLGVQVKSVFQEKLQIEKDLNKIQRRLRTELEIKVEQQQEINQLLQTKSTNQELALQVSELNHTVLRNQMNSHFVFNVLNSIKSFMLQNRKEKAITFLSKFAKFMRKVLDANFYNTISLHEELESIELYLSIELVRFRNSFSYLIDVSPNVDLHNQFVPAFILQPFIENVLWHGFKTKTDNKFLLIQVTKDSVIIEDNGIGREAAKKLKTQEVNTKKSYGLKIVQERLDFYNSNNQTHIHFEIEDIPTGTRVILSFS